MARFRLFLADTCHRISPLNRTGLDCLFILMNYGDQWRLHRRAFHQSFNENAVKQFQPVQLKSARKLLAALLHAPHELKAQANL